jgi:hypothetical protein
MLDPVNSEELKNAALVFWSQDSIFFLPEQFSFRRAASKAFAFR